jgi:hypothetical protein
MLNCRTSLLSNNNRSFPSRVPWKSLHRSMGPSNDTKIT